MRALIIGAAAVLLILLVYGTILVFPRPLSTLAIKAISYTAEPGQYAVEEINAEWQDTRRGRTVPVKIYYPAKSTIPCPVIVFSHGLGSSRDGYSYLGKHWASNGYLVVHVTHVGSDTSVWAGQQNPVAAMHAAVFDPMNALNRQGDISFALDELTRLNNADAVLKGKMDLARIGIAGHSFGSFTTLVATGMALPIPNIPLSLAEKRIKAGIAISSPVFGMPAQYPQIYGGIKTPILHVTGTNDLIEDNASQRRIPFDQIKNADQFLVTFKGADHLLFAGDRHDSKAQQADTIIMNDTLICTTAFWDAYLRNDPGAKKWLTTGEFTPILGDDGVWEQRIR